VESLKCVTLNVPVISFSKKLKLITFIAQYWLASGTDLSMVSFGDLILLSSAPVVSFSKNHYRHCSVLVVFIRRLDIASLKIN